MPVDVAIIGAGPAGCAAAVQCRRLGLSVALVDSSGMVGGLVRNAWRIENEPATGGPIVGTEYVSRLDATIKGFGIEVIKGKVTSVGGRFELSGEITPLSSSAVILATGTSPQAAGIEGEEELAGRLLHYEVASAVTRSPRSALVIGGGEAAFDNALSLAQCGAIVTVAMRDGNHRANRRLSEAVEAHASISVAGNTHVEKMLASEGRCRATCIAATKRYEMTVDVVVVAVGRVPALPTISAALRDPAGGKEKLTIGPGLYIAGDVRLGSLGQSGIAVGDGLEAAQLAADYLSTGECG